MANRKEDERDKIVEEALFEKARDGNVTAATFWLRNRIPEKWRDKREAKPEAQPKARVNIIDDIP